MGCPRLPLSLCTDFQDIQDRHRDRTALLPALIPTTPIHTISDLPPHPRVTRQRLELLQDPLNPPTLPRPSNGESWHTPHQPVPPTVWLIPLCNNWAAHTIGNRTIVQGDSKRCMDAPTWQSILDCWAAHHQWELKPTWGNLQHLPPK
jgi:hypothetical protein